MQSINITSTCWITRRIKASCGRRIEDASGGGREASGEPSIHPHQGVFIYGADQNVVPEGGANGHGRFAFFASPDAFFGSYAHARVAITT